ncbi:MAG: 1-deoxy-D-xylulose-5-phosphate reductoisomerase [bacterium]
MNAPKSIAVLGSTGSIGGSTLDIVRQFPEHFRVHALTCHSSLERLTEQIREFSPVTVTITDPSSAQILREQFPELVVQIGIEGLCQTAQAPEVDLVIAGIVGAAGLPPVFSAVRAGKAIALANKEPLVLAGELLMQEAQRSGALLLPTDSEHNAIFQALQGQARDRVRRVILTASGGAFRDRPLDTFDQITPEEALNHPNWEMGPKITIDSATMMNKGLEVIEAHWLFGVPVDAIEVVQHRQSIVHSLVEYVDGSFLAQLGQPDMRIPISYCMAYPDRLPVETTPLRIAELETLQFEPWSPERYPALTLAFEAAQLGGSAPAVLNGANEEAVSAFLEGRCTFLQIARMLRDVLDLWKKTVQNAEALPFLKGIIRIEDAIAADQWGRLQVRKTLEQPALNHS